MTAANPASSVNPDPARQLLRHTLATLAYRGSKAIRGAPEGFSSFTCGEGCRSAGQILAHIGDLLDWGLSTVRGKEKWITSDPRTWSDEVKRFHAGLAAFDEYLASDQPLHVPAERLFQGPIADALTHVGQIAVLRRLAKSPVKGENYFVADIAVGRVNSDQAQPRFEF